MITAILGLVAAVTAALISRSVMISNHRQAWINSLRDELAMFFAAIDELRLSESEPSHDNDGNARLVFRKIVMQLNMNEPLHQKLEKALENLLTSKSDSQNPLTLAEAVRLARIVLKQEWEVTKYGPFTQLVARLKSWRNRAG